eukprot:m.439082 g.439082  ORF g.439082 m.439082 type:complete len:406 (+) comp18330_c0_seq1:222-1439(+)
MDAQDMVLLVSSDPGSLPQQGKMARLSIAATVAILASGAAARPSWDQLDATYTFKNYLKDFQKWYDGEEYAQREQLFNRRLSLVLEHNNDGSHSWKRGINQFSDWSDEERAQHRGLDKALLYHSKTVADADFTPDVVITAEDLPKDAPTSLDWRTHSPGTVSSVKNQGSCGSCWTFASAETLESRWFIATGDSQDLSEQFILDCTLNPLKCGGTGGCDGGTAELAYARIKATGGIPSEWTYPYVSGTGNASTCHGLPLPKEHPHSGAVMAAATVTGFGVATSNNDAAVQAALLQGPLAISVDAGAWHDYESGIFSGGNKTNPDLDHLVQLVGYGDNNGTPYWIVRNSWTPLWGDHGYIYLARNSDCGIDVTPLDGNGCAGGPPTIKVCGQSGMLFDAVFPTVSSQ